MGNMKKTRNPDSPWDSERGGRARRIGKMPPTRRPCSCLIANVVVIRCDAIVIDSGAILLFQKVGDSGDSGGWGVLLLLLHTRVI